MEDKLFLLRIILASIMFSIVIAREIPEKQAHINLQTPHKNELEVEDKHHSIEVKNLKHTSRVEIKSAKKKHSKKTKRDSYSNYAKYWAARSSNFGYGGYNSNMPLYLVYNRKIGAYFPYYKDNNVRRRSGNVRKSSGQ